MVKKSGPESGFEVDVVDGMKLEKSFLDPGFVVSAELCGDGVHTNREADGGVCFGRVFVGVLVCGLITESATKERRVRFAPGGFIVFGEVRMFAKPMVGGGGFVIKFIAEAAKAAKKRFADEVAVFVKNYVAVLHVRFEKKHFVTRH